MDNLSSETPSLFFEKQLILFLLDHFDQRCPKVCTPMFVRNIKKNLNHINICLPTIVNSYKYTPKSITPIRKQGQAVQLCRKIMGSGEQNNASRCSGHFVH